MSALEGSSGDATGTSVCESHHITQPPVHEQRAEATATTCSLSNASCLAVAQPPQANQRAPASPRMAHTAASDDFPSVSDLSFSLSARPPTPAASASAAGTAVVADQPRRVMTARDWARSLSGTTSPAKEPRSASISRRDSFAASFASALSAATSAAQDGRDGGGGGDVGSMSGPEEMTRRRFRRAITPRSRNVSLSPTSRAGHAMPSLTGEASRVSPLPCPPPLVHSPRSARFQPFSPFQSCQRTAVGGGGDGAQAAQGPCQDGEADPLSCNTSMVWGTVSTPRAINDVGARSALDGASPGTASLLPSSPSASTSSAALLHYTDQERHFMEANEHNFCLDAHVGELPVPMAQDTSCTAARLSRMNSDQHNTTVIASVRSGSLSRCSQSFSTLFRREASGLSFDGDAYAPTGPTPLAWRHTSLSASSTSLVGSVPCGGYLDSAAGLSSASYPSLEALSSSASGRASPSAMASAATMLAHAAARTAQEQLQDQEDLDHVAATLTSDTDVVVKRHRMESDLDMIARALSSAPSSQLLDGARDGVSPVPYAQENGSAHPPYPIRRRQVSPSVARPTDEEEDHVRLDGSRSPHRGRVEPEDSDEMIGASGRRDRSRTRRDVSLPPPPHCDQTPQPSQCQNRYARADVWECVMTEPTTRSAGDAPPLCRVVDFCPSESSFSFTGTSPTPTPVTSPSVAICAHPTSPCADTPPPSAHRARHGGAPTQTNGEVENEPGCRLSGLSTCSVDSDEPEVDAVGLLRQELAYEDADSLVMQEEEARRHRQHITATSQHARDLLARGDEDSIHLLAELVEEAGRGEVMPTTTDKTGTYADRTPTVFAAHSGRSEVATSTTAVASSSSSPSAVVRVNTPVTPAFQEWCRSSPVTPPSVGFRDVSPPLRERSMAPHEVMREWRRRPGGH